jgi:3-oxoacyl-[acyl-carrier-protein] synthase-3
MQTQTAVDCGLSALGYYLPPNEMTVRDVVDAGQSNSSADKLAQLGFGAIRVACEESSQQMAIEAVRDLERRSGFDLDRIDVVLYAGALGTSSLITENGEQPNAVDEPATLFRFPGCFVQAELGLPNATVIGIAQLACNTFQAALRTARGLIASEPEINHVLCIAADRFPRNARREIVYNLMSDGACAAVVSRGHESNRILSTAHVTRGAYWDAGVSHDQLIAAYFPLARQVIHEAVHRAGFELDELDLFIPHNLNLKSWSILAQVIGLPLDRFFTRNIARIGHVVASDNVINYIDAIEDGRIRCGDKVALFVMGFGAHWSCTVVEA